MSGLMLADVLAQTLYRPPIALLFVGAVVVVLLISGLAAARRERSWWTGVLRLIAMGALIWVLLGYSRTQPSVPSDAAPPRLAVLIDTSASMAKQDAQTSADGPAVSRLQAVSDQYLNAERLAQLRDVAAVELIAFDRQMRPARPNSLRADGEATELRSALAQTRADATLILSDGHDTTNPAAQPGDIASAGRLFAVPVGSPRSAPDLSLQAWPDSDRLFEDQSTTVNVSIQHHGLNGQQARVELLHHSQVIETRPITLDERNTTVRFEVSPPLKTGRIIQANHYTTRASLIDGEEAYPDNNTQDVFIQTSRGKIKVLLLEGEPYWDTRSLARLVTRHPRFDLAAVYGFGAERRARLFGESIDATADPAGQLDRFDIVILGRQVQRLVDPGFAQRLSGFVRSGGAVVFARGQPFDREDERGALLLEGIEAISPVLWGKSVVEQMRVRLGEAGDTRGPLADLQDGEVLSRLPGMLAATRIDGRKTASLVMLDQQAESGPPMAALTSLRVGSGISMAVLTEGLWRWELLPGVDESDPQLESIYGVFWVRALQWLASGGAFLPGQDIAIEADRLTIEPGEPITLTISTRYVEADALDLQLTAVHTDGSALALKPTANDSTGTYTASFTPEQTGVYTFNLTAPGRNDLIEPAQPLTTRVAVIDRSPERRDTSAKPEALKQLVEPTGGQCLTLDEPKPLIDYLQTLHALRGSQDHVDYAFNTWPIFALIAGCFGLEWILRRRSGLR